MARLTAARASALAWALPLAMLGAAVLAACGGARGAREAAGRAGRAGREVASNVRFEDYAGSGACQRCHAAQYDSWIGSAMHNMTREADRAVVRGPFDGTALRFKDDTARLEAVGGARFITITSSRFGGGTYRVTRVIGGHHREDYVGVLVSAARPDAPTLSEEELVMPVSFVYATQSLRYKGYSVMVKERAGLRPGPTWSQTCIFCHNTPPHLSTVLGALAGRGAGSYQGEVVDALLPPGKRAEWIVTDEDAFGAALAKETARLGAEARGKVTARRAVDATRVRFRKEHLVEVGIGCEACHLGSAEHVRDPAVLPSFEPRSAFLRVRYPGGAGPAEARASRINRTCAKCHQVLFSGYEPTWEGGTRGADPGGSNINSGEARDMLLGACATKLTCVECHDPHARDATASLRVLGGSGQNALCTRCHDKYAPPDAARAHSHHDPTREGGACMGCHMPRKNMSLDGGLTRYHRIGSPTAAPRVLLDRPLECALCHADATVEKLVTTMERWWKRAYDREALVKLYGAMDANVVLATAERGKPHEQAVAFQLLGDARAKTAIPLLARQLQHPYPIVRGYAKRALDAIAGAPIPVDIDADDVEIEVRARALWGGGP